MKTNFLDILTDTALLKSLKEEIHTHWSKFNNNLAIEEDNKKKGKNKIKARMTISLCSKAVLEKKQKVKESNR